MNSITSLIPRPRPVVIESANLTFQVGEFTLNDLADLQSILDAQWVDPMIRVEAELDAAHGDDRRKLLVSAHEEAKAGPSIYGEPSGQPFYASLAGVAAFLWVALRRHHPEVTPEKAAELAPLVSAGEYSQIWRIAHGAKSLAAIERMLGNGQAKRGGREVTWGQLIDEVCQSHPGWTYGDVYGLTVTEFLNARRMGKPEKRGVPVAMNSEALVKAMREQKERYYGPEAKEGASDGTGN